MGNDSAQHAISAFIASFIFAMVALTALGLGYYGDTGRFVLLSFTVYVLGYLILALLRWIDTLSKLGRMSHTITTVENAALPPLRSWHLAPALGGRDDAPVQSPSGVRIHGERSGFLKYIDVAALQKHAVELEGLLHVHVRVRPGDFVAPCSVLAVLVGPKAPEVHTLKSMAKAFSVGRDRTEEQDPRFGLVILNEIAQRAWSSAVNDPGTAVMVVGGLTRVLIDGTQDLPDEARPEVQYDRVTVVPVDQDGLLGDVFEPIARDGAHMLEVGLAVQRALALLEVNTPPHERGCAARSRAHHGPRAAGAEAGARA